MSGGILAKWARKSRNATGVVVSQAQQLERANVRLVNTGKERAMEPVYFVMAILGCGDFQDQCQQARLEPTRYTSVAQCQAAMTEVLPRHMDLSFPTVVAACERRGQQMARIETRPRG